MQNSLALFYDKNVYLSTRRKNFSRMCSFQNSLLLLVPLFRMCPKKHTSMEISLSCGYSPWLVTTPSATVLYKYVGGWL